MVMTQPLEKSLSLYVLPHACQHHRLHPPSRNLSFFQKHLPHFLLCQSYLSSLSVITRGPCYKLIDNQSITSLGSSSFVLPPEETQYLYVTGTHYHLASCCIFFAFWQISLRSLKNHILHQQASLPCCLGKTCSRAVITCFIFLWFIFLYKYCSFFSHPPWFFSFQTNIEVSYNAFM